MPTDVYEMYVDLEEKWSMENLTKRLKERINEHLRFNTINRDSLLRQVDKIAAEARTKSNWTLDHESMYFDNSKWLKLSLIKISRLGYHLLFSSVGRAYVF